MFDCCHSGTIMDFPYNINDSSSSADKKYEMKASCVCLSGCRDNQYSYESQLGGKRHGALTYNFDNIMRTNRGPFSYQYLLNNASVNSSIWSNHCGWTFYELDFNLLQNASKKFVGRHDFSAFRSAECQAKSPVRTIESFTLQNFNNFYLFTINGDGFLHHQIRNMIATIIIVSKKEIPISYIDTLFQHQDRSLTPATFAPDGLYLTNIKYEKIWGFPSSMNTVNIFKT